MENEVVLRTLTAGDHADLRRLMAQAFSRGRVVKEEEQQPDDGPDVDAKVGVFEADQLCAALTIRPFQIHWPHSVTGTLSMGGIAGVATCNEVRGRGYVDRLLRDSLVRMRDAGQTVSVLNPFAWAFYRRFGWEWVGERRMFTLPLTAIKAAPEGKRVRLIPTEDAERLLSPVYERFCSMYRGTFATGSHHWKGTLSHNDDRTTYVYGYFPEGSDEPTAYLLWRYDGQGDGGEVREWVATTPDGHRALLSLLHYLATQSRVARVTLPQDTPLWSHLMHWDLQTTIQPVFMGRVVDVCAAMGQLLPPSDLSDVSSMTMAIHDSAASWNDGVFRVTVGAGHVVCQPENNAGTADVTLDIQAFSQVFWGTPSLEALQKAGRLEINNAAGFGTLSRLLPAAPVFVMDFF